MKINKKNKLLKENGIWNKNHQKVKNSLFEENDFFDPKDIIQVKYEMLRKINKENASITDISIGFGFSRPAIYKTIKDFKEKGFLGFIPQKPGPQNAHKLTEKIMNFIEEEKNKDSNINALNLSKLLLKKFNLKVHPRSIERAINRQKKNTKDKK
jgi:transposase